MMNRLFGSAILFFLTGICSGQVPHLFENAKEAWKTRECLEAVKPEVKRLIEYTVQQRLSQFQESTAQVTNLNTFLTENVYLGCPKGWSYFDGKCYLFSDDKQDWNTAKMTCRASKGHLVEVDSRKENDYLKSVAASHGVNFWIGASDQASEGNWIWVKTGRDVMSGFVDWTSPQPDNYKGNQDCAVMWTTTNFSWDDQHCPAKQRFICEQSANRVL